MILVLVCHICQKISWAANNPPWIDSRGPWERFSKSVKLKKELHDTLSSKYWAKLQSSTKGIELKGTQNGGTAEKRKKLSSDAIKCADGALATIENRYKVNDLKDNFGFYNQFLAVKACTSGTKVIFTGLENCFDTVVSR